MKKAIFIGVLLNLIWTAVVFGFDPKRYTPYQETVDIYFFEDTPELRSEIRFSFQFGNSEKRYNSGGEVTENRREERHKQALLVVDGRYRIYRNLELRLMPSFISQQVENDLSSWTGRKLGQTQIALKYARPDSSNISWAFRVGTKFPTGDDTADDENLITSSGQQDFDLSGLWAYSSGRIIVSGDFGYRIRLENNATRRKPGNEIHYYFITEMRAHPNIYIFLRNYGFLGQNHSFNGQEISDSAQSINTLLPGFRIRIDTLSLSVSAKFSLVGKNYPVSSGWVTSLNYRI